MPKESLQERVRQRGEIHYRREFDVVMLNDDFTPMDFVVGVLRRVFFHSEDTAYLLMLSIHNEGEAVVGRYSEDIAASKIRKSEALAREEGYPLSLEMREAK